MDQVPPTATTRVQGFDTKITSLLTKTHPVAGLDERHIRNNLDGSLGDLGGDGEGLEEGGLLGTHAGVLGGHRYVQRGESASLGRGLHLVSQQEVPARRYDTCEAIKPVMRNLAKLDGEHLPHEKEGENIKKTSGLL